MVFIPVDMDLRNYVDIGLFIWFTTVAIRAAMSGSVIETRLIAKLLYRFYPENFKQWRDIEDGERDVLIGFYFGLVHLLCFPFNACARCWRYHPQWRYGMASWPIHAAHLHPDVWIICACIRFVASWEDLFREPSVGLVLMYLPKP